MPLDSTFCKEKTTDLNISDVGNLTDEARVTLSCI